MGQGHRQHLSNPCSHSRLFAFLQERVHCDRCAKDTHRSSYTQYFFNVAATALRMMAMTVQMDLDDAHKGPGPPPKALMSGLLKRIEAQVAKTCDTDEGGVQYCYLGQLCQQA